MARKNPRKGGELRSIKGAVIVVMPQAQSLTQNPARLAQASQQNICQMMIEEG